MILLPKNIRILCRKGHGELLCGEYNLYYRNFISPLQEGSILEVRCEYGMNLGNCWRLCAVPDSVSSFPLQFLLYEGDGRLLEQAATTVTLVCNDERTSMRLLVIGDSMTHNGFYVEQLATAVKGITFIGTRNVRGQLLEGRGGWTIERYLRQSAAYLRGVSPFTFPVNVSGKDYYGDYDFWNHVVQRADADPYLYKGFAIWPMQPGQVCLKAGQLQRMEANGSLTPLPGAPEFACDFGKYLERFSLEVPQAVSLLFGANEMQKVPMEKTEAAVQCTIASFCSILGCIRKAVPGVPVIINLPVCGAEQYAWGKRLGCNWSADMYNFHVRKLCEALLKEFDDREAEEFYISPMLHAIDPVYGFDFEQSKPNQYTDVELPVHSNWVHPCENGYRQMGDALAGTIAYIKQKKEN